MKGMTAADNGELLKTAFQFQLALVSNSNLSPSDFSSVQRSAKDLYADIQGNLKPWTGATKEDRDTNMRNEFAAQWKEIAGFDLDDEDAKAKWEDEIRNYQSDSAKELQEQQQAEHDLKESFNRRKQEILDRRLRQQQGR